MSKTLLHGAWVCAEQDGRQVLIENAYVGIEGDSIAFVGKSRPQDYDRADCIERPYGLIIPGLIDLHYHSDSPATKGFCEDCGSADLYGSILYEYLTAIYAATTVEDWRAIANLTFMEMIAGGITTCVEFNSYYPVEMAELLGDWLEHKDSPLLDSIVTPGSSLFDFDKPIRAVCFSGGVADCVYVHKEGPVRNGAKRAADDALAAADALLLIDHGKAVFIHGDGVHRAGPLAGTHPVHDGIVGAGFHTLAAFFTFGRIDTGLAVLKADRAELTRGFAFLGHTHLAVFGYPHQRRMVGNTPAHHEQQGRGG